MYEHRIANGRHHAMSCRQGTRPYTATETEAETVRCRPAGESDMDVQSRASLLERTVQAPPDRLPAPARLPSPPRGRSVAVQLRSISRGDGTRCRENHGTFGIAPSRGFRSDSARPGVPQSPDVRRCAVVVIMPA